MPLKYRAGGYIRTALENAKNLDDVSNKTTARSNLGLSNSDIVDIVYPVGCQYTMYAVAASNTASTAFPYNQQPAQLFGGTWELLWDNESVFFRTEGSDASDDRASGKQQDQFQGHQHTGIYNELDGNELKAYSGSGTNDGIDRKSSDDYARNLRTGDPTGSYGGAWGSARYGSETRPKNRLFRIYRRTS